MKDDGAFINTVEYLKAAGKSDVKKIAEELGISESTVRRKLEVLEKKGIVKRDRGEVELCEEAYTGSFEYRTQKHASEKRAIALKALRFVKDGDVVFLDGSTSTFFIGEYLSEFDNLKVVTNGIDTLSFLAKNGVSVYSTGGQANPDNRAVLTGEIALGTVKKVRANVCFFSAGAIDKNGDIYDSSGTGEVINEMINRSDLAVFLCDSTKMLVGTGIKICSLFDIDYAVTEKDVRDFFVPELRKKIIF